MPKTVLDNFNIDLPKEPTPGQVLTWKVSGVATFQDPQVTAADKEKLAAHLQSAKEKLAELEFKIAQASTIAQLSSLTQKLNEFESKLAAVQAQSGSLVKQIQSEDKVSFQTKGGVEVAAIHNGTLFIGLDDYEKRVPIQPEPSGRNSFGVETVPALKLAVDGAVALSNLGYVVSSTQPIGYDPVTHRIVLVKSSERYKNGMQEVSSEDQEKIDALFRNISVKRYYDNRDEKHVKLHYGLSAEELVEMFPDAVIRDKDGKPDSVDYSLISLLAVAELKRMRTELDSMKVEKVTPITTEEEIIAH